MSSKSSFTRPRHLRVHWDDEPEHPLHGAQIRMKRLSIGALMQLATLRVADDDDDAVVVGSEMRSIVDQLVNGLVSWNLVDESEDEDGEPSPRPATREELESDAELCMALLEKWMDVAGSVSGPLAERSGNGSQSRAVSDLTALPSQSL